MRSLLVCTFRVLGAAPGLGTGGGYTLGSGEAPGPRFTVCRDEAVWGAHLGFAVLRLGVVCHFVCSYRLIRPEEVLSPQSCPKPGVNCGVLLLWSLSLLRILGHILIQMFDLSSVACKENMYVTSYEREFGLCHREVSFLSLCNRGNERHGSLPSLHCLQLQTEMFP